MVVHLDADAALTTVESPRRSQVLARVAITQFVMSLSRLDEAMFENVATFQALFMTAGWQVLKLVETVVLVDRIGQFKLLHGFAQFQSMLVLNVIFLMRIDFVYLDVLYFSVHEYARYNAWLGE